VTHRASVDLPGDFARVVAEAIPGILNHQQPGGSIVYDAKAPVNWPQQAVFPLAFCWAGLDPEKRWHQHGRVRESLDKLTGFLLQRLDDKGEFSWDSHGHKVSGVDQRLIYAWIEGLRTLRENGGDFPFDAWGKKILAACENLIEHRLRKLEGVRRFIARVMGTSTNHVALYLSTIHRAGQVLGRDDLCRYVLPIARALAQDIHPDGYWEEHGDLLRTGGPTPSYNYLTHCGMALLYEWTGEGVFRAAIERSTRFHGNFCYPDASFFELIDERVRHGHGARVWGLFGFSHSAEGRGTALAHFNHWCQARKSVEDVSPELLARHCENFLYWHGGEATPAPFESWDHHATLTLPAGIFRRGVWCVGLNAMRATNAEDPAYRDSPFGLEKQKLFSVWHEAAGLILDGSHAKDQPENSTFATQAAYSKDHYPCGGSVGEEDGDWIVNAAYKTFHGQVRLRVLSEQSLQIDLSIDPAGNRGPFTAGFTLIPREPLASGLSGRSVILEHAEPVEVSGKELGGGFHNGIVTVKGPENMKLVWPYSPFNSYAKDRKSGPAASLLRVCVELTPEHPRASFVLSVAK